MKKNNLIGFLILIILILYVMFVYAGNSPFSGDLNRTGNESCGNVINFSGGITADGAGNCHGSQNVFGNYIYNLSGATNSANITMLAKVRVTSCAADTRLMDMETANGTTGARVFKIAEGAQDLNAGKMELANLERDSICVITGFIPDNTWQFLRVTTDSANSKATAYINNSDGCTISTSSGGGANFWNWGTPSAVNDACVYDFTNQTFLNGSVYLTTTGPAPSPAVPNLTITAIDAFNGIAINNFTIRMQNASDGFNQSTGNGTSLITNVTSGFFNITIVSNQSGGYISRTYNNSNVSSNSLVAEVWQAEIYVNASNIASGVKINDFGIRVNGSSLINLSNSSGFANFKLKAGTYNLTGNNSLFDNVTSVFTVANYEQRYVNISFGKFATLTVNATNLITSKAILSFDLKLVSNDTPSVNINKTTSSGSLQFTLLNGTYNLTFVSTNFSTSITQIIINVTDSNLPNYTFNIYSLNSINFSIYDELQGKINFFNGTPVTIQLVSDLYSTNFSTNNGSFYLDLIAPSDYRISYVAAGYRPRDYFFTLTNGTHNQADLYLLSITNGTLVTFTVQDDSAKSVQGATIQLLRYYVASNSYIQVDSEKTDINGNAIIDVDYNNAFYQTITSLGNAITISQKTKIYTTSPLIILNFGQNPINNVNTINAIGTSLTFNNNTNTFSYTFIDTNQINRIGTLRVNQITSTGNNKVCENTLTAASGTLLCNVNTSNGIYLAQGFMQLSSTTQETMTNSLEIIDGYIKAGKQVFQTSGMLLAIIFAATVAGLGVINPAISIVLFVAALGSMFFAGFAFIPLGVYISISIIGLIVAYKIRT